MQISNNIVNGPKSNNEILLGIWVIVCIQKPSHTFCRPFVHFACLRYCSAIVHFIRNNCLYFLCYGWSALTLTALTTLTISVAWKSCYMSSKTTVV